MWEFCVRAGREHKNSLNYVYDSLLDAVKSLNGVITQVPRGEFFDVALAVADEHRPKIKGMLDALLSNVFCEQFKYEYLKEHTNLVGKEREYFEAFVKVLTYFDSELDRKILARLLVYENRIVLESFFEFRLRPLKKKWEELTRLTNDNAFLFVSSETFIELLKFLIGNIESKINDVTVKFEDKIYFLENKSNGSKVIDEFGLADEAGALAAIIEISPKVLRIEGKINKMTDLLCELFAGRVRNNS